jgi:hypothetical protein
MEPGKDKVISLLQDENAGMRNRIDRLGAENLTAWDLLRRAMSLKMNWTDEAAAWSEEVRAFLAGVPAENPDIHRVTLEDRVTQLETRVGDLEVRQESAADEEESPGVFWPDDKELVTRRLRFPNATLLATLNRVYGWWREDQAAEMNVPGIVRSLDQEARQSTRGRVPTVATWFPEVQTAEAFLRLADEWRIGD